MSEKLLEIAKANSKGIFVGRMDEHCLNIAFQPKNNSVAYSGFRFLWYVDLGFRFKGFIGSVNSFELVGLWIYNETRI